MSETISLSSILSIVHRILRTGFRFHLSAVIFAAGLTMIGIAGMMMTTTARILRTILPRTRRLSVRSSTPRVPRSRADSTSRDERGR